MSLFPPSAPTLPRFSTLLVTGKYHPSAPIHLALSLQTEGLAERPLILHPSRADLKANLANFNDAWLASRSGHGKMTSLASEVAIYYPPSPAHLCMLLSVLCASPSDTSGPWTGHVPARVPSVIILVEPSRYLMQEVHTQIDATLPSYLNLIHRVFACLSSLKASSLNRVPLFALFDSQLHTLKLPVIHPPSIVPESHATNQARQPHALLLVEKYFDWVVIFEEDSFFIPSSQGEEAMNDEGAREQLQYYDTHGREGSTIELRWLEIPSSKGTEFRWPAG